ncbi:DUF4032 domain-containing protein [bacterium]|nr:DUF4032 domain-containing protein [bacterium]
MAAPHFEFSLLREGIPDFLDLPWDLPLEEWEGRVDRLEQVPRGISRHEVVFVNYDGVLYAIKQLPPEIAAREYASLLEMEERRLPVVRAWGHLDTHPYGNPTSILITRYLIRSLPYQTLFAGQDLMQTGAGLLDAMAGLLVQLHLAGVFWGDCSLANTLFRRDAGTLQAYLVDAETAEVRDQVSDGMRSHDLDIMEENVAGMLADLAAMKGMTAPAELDEVGRYIRSSYRGLWQEITREEELDREEGWRIQQRIRRLNDLGFSVREVAMTGADGRLRFRPIVADRHYHRDLLHSLTGIDAEEEQARQLINEVQQHRIALSDQQGRSVSLSAAAFHWQLEVFRPLAASLVEVVEGSSTETELYCALLEHKWYLSEHARRDVGHKAALEDMLQNPGMMPSTAGGPGL